MRWIKDLLGFCNHDYIKYTNSVFIKFKSSEEEISLWQECQKCRMCNKLRIRKYQRNELD